MNRKNFFFIVGGQRCGSTYLYGLLDEHPEICMAKPVRPEPKFFITDNAYKKGVGYYTDKFFYHKKDERVFGEKSTSYFELETAAQRIKLHFPESKILIILRNPVERAISNYFFSVKNGYEHRGGEEALIHENEIAPTGNLDNISVSPFNYLLRGNYHALLEKYLSLFHPENIKIIILEDLLQNIKICKEIYEFLGVDHCFTPKSFNAIVNKGLNKKEVSDQIRTYLFNYYHPSIDELENFLDYKIAAWHK